MVLLGVAFAIQTLDQCEDMFGFVECNVQVWKEECFFTACKDNLLRICDDLLLRFFYSQNTAFYDRIHLFRDEFFLFVERSGLNIVLEFNDSDGDTDDQMSATHEQTQVTPEMLKEIADKIEDDWKELACKFGLYPDEIQYFEAANPTVPEQCEDMLRTWLEDDEDANLRLHIGSPWLGRGL